MALANPLPFRDFYPELSTMRRSIRASSDHIPPLENGAADEESPARLSSKIDMKQLVSAGKVNASISSLECRLTCRLDVH